jgi:hypothetical protein
MMPCRCSSLPERKGSARVDLEQERILVKVIIE